jgi:hypothetical protein
MSASLGLLEQIEDLKEVWKSEAKHFTPWLAEENNLKQLGNAIGLDLELDEVEKNVGPYRADILCKEPGTEHFILIENQIEKTDHTHLGQILTYAAGLNAVTVVWIAKKFTDEHRAAIDWLNIITGNDFSFFGLEIELWRIGNSPIAPKFNIVSKPNEWTKGGGSASSSKNLSPTKVMQLEYWTKFREYVLQNGNLIRPHKANAQHWMTFSIGRTGFYMYAFMDTQKSRIGIRLVMDGENAKPHYKLLKRQRKDIDKEFGQGSLQWQEFPEQKNSYISLYNNSANPKKKKEWDQQFAYLLENLEKYHKVFASRIKELDAGDWVEED